MVLLLQPFYSNQTTRLVKTPKLYFLDMGLCAFLTGWSSPETVMRGAMSGAIFETYIVGEIYKSWIYHGKQPNFFYFCDKDFKEIDLIIEANNKLYPIEIKLASQVKREWSATFKLLKRFTQNKINGCVICLSNQYVPIEEHIMACPVSAIG